MSVYEMKMIGSGSRLYPCDLLSHFPGRPIDTLECTKSSVRTGDSACSKAKITAIIRVRIRPRIHDDWRIDSADDNGVQIHNLATGHTVLLGYDQIHSYRSDPNRSTAENRHGFLQLRLQIRVSPGGLQTEPLPSHFEKSSYRTLLR